MPVRIMMCPDLFSRMAGKAALMMLTGPKKLDSNCSRTRVRERGEAPNSSTVPMTASGLSVG